jgi:hypothetical protein
MSRLLLRDQLEAPPAIGGNPHLVLKPHVVIYHLAGHADVVGDLVNILAFRPTCEDAGATQAMNGWPFNIVRVDFPFILGNLGCNPFPPLGAKRKPVFAPQPTMPPCMIGAGAERLRKEGRGNDPARGISQDLARMGSSSVLVAPPISTKPDHSEAN